MKSSTTDVTSSASFSKRVYAAVILALFLLTLLYFSWPYRTLDGYTLGALEAFTLAVGLGLFYPLCFACPSATPMPWRQRYLAAVAVTFFLGMTAQRVPVAIYFVPVVSCWKIVMGSAVGDARFGVLVFRLFTAVCLVVVVMALEYVALRENLETWFVNWREATPKTMVWSAVVDSIGFCVVICWLHATRMNPGHTALFLRDGSFGAALILGIGWLSSFGSGFALTEAVELGRQQGESDMALVGFTVLAAVLLKLVILAFVLEATKRGRAYHAGITLSLQALFYVAGMCIYPNGGSQALAAAGSAGLVVVVVGSMVPLVFYPLDATVQVCLNCWKQKTAWKLFRPWEYCCMTVKRMRRKIESTTVAVGEEDDGAYETTRLKNGDKLLVSTTEAEAI